LSAGGTAGPLAGFGSFCVVKSDTGEIGLEASVGASQGITTNTIHALVALFNDPEAVLTQLLSANFSGGYQSSNATAVCELGGPFSYSLGSIGFGIFGSRESFSNGEGVSGKTYSLGRGAGLSFTQGTSDTLVLAFPQNSPVAKVVNPVLDFMNQHNPIWNLGF
jgi:hypothetical protein